MLIESNGVERMRPIVDAYGFLRPIADRWKTKQLTFDKIAQVV
jgi:hypothetical protein